MKIRLISSKVFLFETDYKKKKSFPSEVIVALFSPSKLPSHSVSKSYFHRVALTETKLLLNIR